MTPPLEGVVEKKKAAVVGETTAAFFFGTRGRLPPPYIKYVLIGGKPLKATDA